MSDDKVIMMDLDDQFEESYKKLNNKIGDVATYCIITTMVMQYLTAFYKIFTGSINEWSELFQYLIYYLVGGSMLFGLSFTVIACIEKMLKLDNISIQDKKRVRLKQGTSIARIAVVTWVVPMMHIIYPTVYIAPIACILTSAVYGDPKLVKKTTNASMIALGAIFILCYFWRHDVLPPSYSLQCVIAEGIMVMAYIIASGLVTIEENKEIEQWDAQERERTDGLTGLWNRKKLNEVMANHYDILTIAMIDIDKFKNVNDTYGHPFGDVVLRRLAAVIKEHETADIKGFRYGGEEFLVAFKGNTSKDKVINVLSELKSSFCAQTYEEHPEVKCTLSIGVASSNDFFPINFKALVAKADEALYMAKNTGRNKIMQAVPKENIQEAETTE